MSLNPVSARAGQLTLDVRLVNERELLRLLGKIDNDARKQVQRDIVRMAAPMAGRAKQLAPQTAPLYGWAHNGRTGWKDKPVINGYRVRFGGRGFTNATGEREFPLLTLEARNPAGAIFDWAGRKSGQQSSQFTAQLANEGWGLGWTKGAKYSRVLFPAYVAEKQNVIANIQSALDEVARRINREMR